MEYAILKLLVGPALRKHARTPGRMNGAQIGSFLSGGEYMAKSIRKLAVVGAGTMGAAIAACGARAGLDVVLMVRGKGEESGRARAAKAVAEIVKKGEMKGSDEARILAGVACADMQQDARVHLR